MDKTCPEISTCLKVKSLGDHDWAGDWQYAEAVQKMCEKCEERSGRS